MGAYPSSPKGGMTYYLRRSTILPNFIALRRPTPEISLTKNPADKLTNTETVSNISQHAYRHVGITRTPVIRTGV